MAGAATVGYQFDGGGGGAGATGATGATGQAQLFYTAFSAPVTISGTSEGAATAVVTLGAQTYVAALTRLEFFTPGMLSDTTGTIIIVVYDGSTALGELAFSSLTSNSVPCMAAIELTPTAGSHTYNVKAWVSGGTGTGSVFAGAGGSGNQVNGYLKASLV